MPGGEMVQVEGEVFEVLPDRRYRVELTNGEEVLATVAGRAPRGLRVLPGDRVRLELSPYDLSRGRIIDRAETKGEA